jgi:hypothetical protein
MTNDHGDGVLTPADLDFDDEHVRPLGEGRYVVDTPQTHEADPTTDGGDPHRDRTAVGDRPGGRLDELEGAYAIVADGRTGTSEGHVRIDTNDVSEAFEALVRWYAGRVADGTSPEAVVQVLLESSDLDVDIEVRRD